MPPLLMVLASLAASSAHPACEHALPCEATLGVISPHEAQACIFKPNPKLNDTEYDRCVRFMDTPERTAPPDGIYGIVPKDSTDESITAIEQSFLLPLTGSATLADGRRVAFFQQDAFNTNGNRVYLQSPEGSWHIAPTGHYTLASGQALEVEDGFIPQAFFDSATRRIQHENRD